jgi:hypothetical protein
MLANLLHSKFHNKYQIDYTLERSLDQAIRQEIMSTLQQVSSIHEKDLNELDARIKSVVAAYRSAQ